MICCKRELGCMVRADLPCLPPNVFVSVSIPAKTLSAPHSLHIILTYIPSNIGNKFPERLNKIQEISSRLVNLHPDDYYLLIGDLNLYCILWREDGYIPLHEGSIETQNAAVDLIDTLGLLGLTQYNKIENHKGKCLDVAFSNLPLVVTRCEPISREDLYHPALAIEIHDINITPLKENLTPKYNFEKGRYEEINSFLSSLDWSSLLSEGNLDDKLHTFYSKIYNSFETFIPKSTPKNNHYPSWYSSPLIKLIKEKSKIHKRWKKFHNIRDYDEFSLLRARQHKLEKQCFDNFTRRAEERIRRSPKMFWSYVKSKRGTSNYPKQLTFENNTYDSGEAICAAFSKFFQKMFNSSTDIVDYGDGLPISASVSNTDGIANVYITEESV